ncbi:AfsR/SARP family transcriptional regulator [Kitasatospora sp. GAS204B]|uniref:AfsR/SARP family transcriptional regulator n=1 Tax=unclassified Kitasatospora TaxID=2633591 RepID=UPI0024759D57|nr:AfsR/SARP family transcriptional regulator [Kitasatospora sp. GAS204B]MDH6119875.1 DNA-binding SARP family transcriptional activator [Kitasatospora sp. GAS204B]
MEFGILGPLLVRDDAGQPHGVPAPKQRVLLATLLLRRGQVCSPPLLAERLWDGCPPRGATAALQNAVLRLRRCLGPAGGRLETCAGGYRLAVDPEEFDVHRFTELRTRGAAALRAREYERALGLLDAALDVWRGEALLDVPSDALHREEAGRLADERLHAVEARVEAELQLERHSVVPELQALTAAHPGRERFWAQLMTALTREGRQAEALSAYGRVQQLLDEQLGVHPGPELRELHRRILRADRPVTGRVPAQRTVRAVLRQPRTLVG